MRFYTHTDTPPSPPPLCVRVRVSCISCEAAAVDLRSAGCLNGDGNGPVSAASSKPLVSLAWIFQVFHLHYSICICKVPNAPNKDRQNTLCSSSSVVCVDIQLAAWPVFHLEEFMQEKHEVDFNAELNIIIYCFYPSL